MRILTFQDVLQQEEYQSGVQLGDRAVTEDGREWVYCKMNEAIATTGMALTRTANTNADTAASSNDSAGNATVITETDSSWTPGDFDDAYGIVDDGTGEGQFFKIRTNSVTKLFLYTDYAIATAITVAGLSDLLLVRPFLAEKVAITTSNQVIVGVVQTTFTTKYHGWALTRGPGALLMGEAPTANYTLTPGDNTEGTCLMVDSGDDLGDASCIGRLLVANASADKACMADINIL